MSRNQYKKTYEGDYSKSYRDYTAWTKEVAQKRQEYQSASKKRAATHYNKEERSEVYNMGHRPKESERVYAEGGHPQAITTPKPQNKTNIPDTKPKPPAPQVSPAQTEVRPSREVRSQNVYDTYETEDDGNYNYYNPPIIRIGENRYRNLKTNKEIEVNEARKVLNLAGYTPKKSIGFGSIIFAFIVANIVFSVVAPFLAIGYGVYKSLSMSTTWTKQNGTNIYNFSLPPSPNESSKNKKIGLVCIVVGILFIVGRYHHLFVS